MGNNTSNSSDTESAILGFLLWGYGIVSQIMALYFWWQYAKEDSFISTITIDIILAEIKGLLWIFFIW
ncbi:MAG: hypothetical protein HDS97_02820 [Bacteroidales bacterium]|nr:hypothetical protein [Bacteroidales bacterium]